MIIVGETMNKSCRVCILCILALVSLVWIECGDKSTNSVPPLGTFKCVIDGHAFTASYETSAYRFLLPWDEYFTITAFGGSGLLEDDSVVVGFFMAEDGDDCPCITSFGGFEEGMFDDATVFFYTDGGYAEYSTAHTGAHGRLYIKFPSSNISGTFSFVAYDPGGLDSIRVTDGSFNLQLRDTTFY